MDNEETTSNETTTATPAVDPTTLFWTWEAGKVITHPRSEFRELGADEITDREQDIAVEFTDDGTPLIRSTPDTNWKPAFGSAMKLPRGSCVPASAYRMMVLGSHERIFRALTPAARDFVARCF